MARGTAISPDQFATFGELLKFLRRRAGLTQRALSIAVGYSDTQISRQENNQRIPDRATITAFYLPALEIEDKLEWAKRLLELASKGIAEERKLTGDTQPAKIAHNLPLYLTSFIGRDQEIENLKRLFFKVPGSDEPSTRKLITIAGPGGIGKTRLAIQIARELVSAFPDGVWLVDLAPISDPAVVPQTIATVLQVRERGNLPISDQLVENLRDKKSLLVLDNCEHLVEACAQLADSLLKVCPGLVILATSRETLGIMGETIFRLTGLAVPDARLANQVDELLRLESAQLFVDRAQNALPSFQATPENAPALARICQQLEGMPLAIELAAARVGMLRVGQIADRLQDATRLLNIPSRAAHPHQQTLLATIDWSYNLLSEPERALFRRLAVFAGGWTLESAEAVAGGDPILPAGEVFELLITLGEKSLVNTKRETGAEARYRCLETIRQYAREKLDESGELGTLKIRHATYMMELVERAGRDPSAQSYLEGWEERLELEHDNLRAALQYSLNNDQVEQAMQLAINLFDFWFDRNYLQEARRWYEAGLRHRVILQEVLLARVLQCAGRITGMQGNYDLAKNYLRESVSILERLGDPTDLANALRDFASTTFNRGDIETATEIDRKVLELYQEADNKAGIAGTLASLGWDEVYLGQVEQGLHRLEESLKMQRELENKYGIAYSARALGICLYLQGQIERAEALQRESVLLFYELKNKLFMCNCLECLAGVAAHRRQAERAATLMGISNRLMYLSGAEDTPIWKFRMRKGIVDLIHSQLEADAFERAHARGRVMADGELSEVVNYALEVEDSRGGRVFETVCS